MIGEQLVELVDLDAAVLESRPGPQERCPVHDTRQFDWLPVYDSLALDLIDELHQALVSLVVLQIVSIHKDHHLILEVLL